MRIAVAQTNPVIGDLAANAQAIVAAARNAAAQGAQLLLTAQGALTGTPLHDLGAQPAFIDACNQQVQALGAALADLPDLVVAVTHPVRITDAGVATVVSAWRNGVCLLNSQPMPCVLKVGDLRVGLVLDADDASTNTGQLEQDNAQLLAVLGSPCYRMGAVQAREQKLAELAQQLAVPCISAHVVGGQGECVYDGASLAVQADGSLAGRAPQFAESVWMVEAQQAAGHITLQASVAAIGKADGQAGGAPYVQAYNHAQVWQALVLATRDYVRKSGFQDVILGMSGGMDSALVLALAVDALGSHHVRTVMMPTAYTANMSLHDAQDMAQRLGVQHDVIPIAPLCAAFDIALKPLFAGRAADVTEENIQARVRGNLLMALSNKFGSMVLATGNKSELATGYCTLYGDMAGGFAPIKDVLKTQVYALARWRNQHDLFGTGAAPIPERIITRPPSAELRPDQTDQDSLPPYEVLDAIVIGYMEHNASAEQLAASGLPPEAVAQVLRLIRLSEYKRQQGAPGPCLSNRAFGADWQYPLVNRFVEKT